MDELIRKKDALDALMAERKHLLDKGRWGAEHVLTHHGYNVIDELPPVQPDVPDTNVGDMISRKVAMEMLMAQNVIMEGSEYHNGFNAGVNRAQEVIRNLPPVQPKQTNCEYCHTDRDGYVFPLEKNSHAFIDRDKIVLKVKGWRGEAKIKYCPICGRRLTDG